MSKHIGHHPHHVGHHTHRPLNGTMAPHQPSADELNQAELSRIMMNQNGAVTTPASSAPAAASAPSQQPGLIPVPEALTNGYYADGNHRPINGTMTPHQPGTHDLNQAELSRITMGSNGAVTTSVSSVPGTAPVVSSQQTELHPVPKSLTDGYYADGKHKKELQALAREYNMPKP